MAAHPVAWCLEQVSGLLAGQAEQALWSLSDPEIVAGLESADRVVAQAAELRLRLVAVAHSRDLAKRDAATSTPAWFAGRARLDRREAGRLVRLAAALDRDATATRTALAAGEVNADQAQVICRVLADLPTDVIATDRVRAEAWLIEQAQHWGPAELARLGKRIFEVIARDQADAREEAALRDEERRARALTWLSMQRRGDGTTRGGFVIPDAQADMLSTVLEAMSAPRRGGRDTADPDGPDPGTKERPLTYPERLGRAFCDLIEHLPTDRLPQAGGVAATLTIDLDYDWLAAQTDSAGAGSCSTGARMSAAQVRRLACNAALIPMVFGGDSVVLDVGRSRRLHDRYQRLALARRDRGCIFPGCDRPPAWCEAHHLRPWSSGGPTSVHDGCLLCPAHHHLVHEQDWTVRLGSNGYPEVLRPGVDPDRRSRQHQRFAHPSPAGADVGGPEAAGSRGRRLTDYPAPMPTWISLLRAVNLGSHNKLPMPALRKALDAAGFEDVRTYVQSGNIVAGSSHRSESGVATAMHDLISAEFGLDVPVIVRKADQLAKVLALDPFPDESATQPKLVAVVFLERPVTDEESAAILEFADSVGEQVHVDGRELYIAYTETGVHASKLTPTAIGRRLGQQGTARNWRTVAALADMTR